jgi:hypothetical protein
MSNIQKHLTCGSIFGPVDTFGTMALREGTMKKTRFSEEQMVKISRPPDPAIPHRCPASTSANAYPMQDRDDAVHLLAPRTRL